MTYNLILNVPFDGGILDGLEFTIRPITSRHREETSRGSCKYAKFVRLGCNPRSGLSLPEDWQWTTVDRRVFNVQENALTDIRHHTCLKFKLFPIILK